METLELIYYRLTGAHAAWIDSIYLVHIKIWHRPRNMKYISNWKRKKYLKKKKKEVELLQALMQRWGPTMLFIEKRIFGRGGARKFAGSLQLLALGMEPQRRKIKSLYNRIYCVCSKYRRRCIEGGAIEKKKEVHKGTILCSCCWLLNKYISYIVSTAHCSLYVQ